MAATKAKLGTDGCDGGTWQSESAFASHQHCNLDWTRDHGLHLASQSDSWSRRWKFNFVISTRERRELLFGKGLISGGYIGTNHRVGGKRNGLWRVIIRRWMDATMKWEWTMRRCRCLLILETVQVLGKVNGLWGRMAKIQGAEKRVCVYLNLLPLDAVQITEIYDDSSHIVSETGDS